MQKQSLKWALALILMAFPLVAGAEDILGIPNVNLGSPVIQPIADPTPSDSVCRDYSGVNFSMQHLPLGKFRHNQLSSACFYQSELTEADFRGASLISANLQGASMMGADLRRANLSSARLEGANLRGATVRHAIFSGATYDQYTQFPTGFVPQQWGMVRVCSP